VQYPAPGDPTLAGQVAEIVKPQRVVQDAKSWGLDHGTWSVLVHMFPEADVPVVQLSIDRRKDFDFHVQLGAALAPLREQGVLILGSGNVVHNLRQLQWDQPDSATAWNQEFDRDARNLMSQRPGDIASLRTHRHYHAAAPTPEHLIPAFYVAGLAAAAEQPAEVLVGGYAMGSLSMTSFVVRGSEPG
jgi:4,5-DOPA dioxygenase extradiol